MAPIEYVKLAVALGAVAIFVYLVVFVGGGGKLY
tara:strand:+ start:2409 stop:2510 length:102 start_codon:yes stop_codon:yes gene_type:complete